MFLKYLIQIIFSPSRGWEDVEYAAKDPRRLWMRGLLPLILLAAATCYMPLIYGHEVTLRTMTAQTVIVGAKYIISYLLLPVILLIYMPHLTNDNYSNLRIDTFTVYTIGYFALVRLIVNCLPVTSSVTDFLPLYAIALVWQSTTYMRVEARYSLTYSITTSAVVLLTPWLIGLFIGLFI